MAARRRGARRPAGRARVRVVRGGSSEGWSEPGARGRGDAAATGRIGGGGGRESAEKAGGEAHGRDLKMFDVIVIACGNVLLWLGSGGKIVA